MRSKKFRNIALSLIILALWVSLILFLSARMNTGDISALYLWMKLTTLIAGFAGLLLLALRMFKVVDRDRNFLYTFFGTVNLVIGLAGICFYLLGKTNTIGLHDTIPNLFASVVMMADLFLFERLFKKEDTL